jgi:hypothetical protein
MSRIQEGRRGGTYPFHAKVSANPTHPNLSFFLGGRIIPPFFIASESVHRAASIDRSRIIAETRARRYRKRERERESGKEEGREGGRDRQQSARMFM